MAMRIGPAMAASDVFELTLDGRGARAAMPHTGIDPSVVGALQTISSRATDALDSVVVSVTQFHAGETWNMIPERALLAGTTRAFRPEVRDAIEPAMWRIAGGVAAAHGATAALRNERRYRAMVNHAAEVVGAANVDRHPAACMGAEDFAFILEARPGAYIWLGNGPGQAGCMLHSPRYPFRDDILPIGASYWAKLVEAVLR